MGEVEVIVRRPFWTPKGLAEHLGVSERTVRGWIMDKTIPSYLIGGSRRIHPDDVDEYLRRCKGAA